MLRRKRQVTRKRKLEREKKDYKKAPHRGKNRGT